MERMTSTHHRSQTTSSRSIRKPQWYTVVAVAAFLFSLLRVLAGAPATDLLVPMIAVLVVTAVEWAYWRR